MKVSMIPDNSVKMIHASQDDAGRRWEFELYDEDGLIDVSSVGEQMVYPVYSGGTEQILSSVPSSDIIADIIYPDEVRTDQEFTYRECPTTEDGSARITKIKGNTLKENDTLIPFMGEQIKTVGFNQWDEEWERGKYTTDTGEKENDSYRIRNKNFISVLPNTEYCIIRPNVSTTVLYYDFDKGYIGTGTITSNLFITPSNCGYVCFYIGSSSNPVTTYGNNICINISDPSKNGQYVPYKESIVNLPTLDYFPTGMKDVPDYTNGGKIYDELSENLASQRVERVDLGSLNWSYQSANTRFTTSGIADLIVKPSSVSADNIECSKYTPSLDRTNLTMYVTNTGTLIVYDLAYTDAATFKQMLTDQNVVLYFALAEPVETSIATASLVSQNQEIPMTVENDKLVAYSTAEVTERSGFHDTKIKLSNDGVAYSAKFTLHVERKP